MLVNNNRPAKGVGQSISEFRKASKNEDEPSAEKAKTDA